MKLLCASVAAALLVSLPAGAQEKFEFEVASVKPFSIGQIDGPVTLGAKIDGAQVRLLGLAMRDLLSSAYRVKLYQLSGPEWIQTERYDISAKLPAGVSPEKLPEMIQTLLAERFGLKVHREQKEMPVYALLPGKPPLRLKEVVVDPNAPPQKAVEVSGTGSAAGISVNLGNGSSYTFAGGKLTATKVTSATIAAVLERFTDRPVMDLTGLKGTYDLEAQFSPEETQTLMIRAAVAAGVQLPPQALRLLDGGGNPIESGAEQLGLKIDGRRMPVDIIVIDQIQKTPTDN
ncbi:MAG TPA: TIGR03435 family protein [Vicinamibacterales bacterium]|nr:TIGR03435 family protein [Vicinamibacterales bacterium]